MTLFENDMKKEVDNIELLLSKFDKSQLCEFIRKECADDIQLQKRFLALGAGTVFRPKSADYQSRVMDIIEDFEGRYGYVRYSDTFNMNRAVCKILDEADVAIQNQNWEVAIAVLEGIALAGEDILNCGDDSAGEVSGIIEECFEKWEELCNKDLLSPKIKNEIFELSIKHFTEQHLKGWDWWWNWIQNAISLADTPEKQERTIKALDDVINSEGERWSDKSNRETAQRYKLEMMSRCGTPEEQRKFMYENAGNPDFRRRLLQMAWNENNYGEVLKLAKDGIKHDSEFIGLVNEWHKWELKTYRHKNDKANTLKLSRYFFFTEGRFGEKEYSMETMYALMKSIVPNGDWKNFVDTLIEDTSKKRECIRRLFIYTQEKMWDRYIEYLRNAPSIYNIDDAPQEVWKLYTEELIKLYSSCVRDFFKHASNRNAYCEGVALLRKLIKYGGKEDAANIIAEQKARTPRRPALLDELSKLKEA